MADTSGEERDELRHAMDLAPLLVTGHELFAQEVGQLVELKAVWDDEQVHRAMLDLENGDHV